MAGYGGVKCVRKRSLAIACAILAHGRTPDRRYFTALPRGATVQLDPIVLATRRQGVGAAPGQNQRQTRVFSNSGMSLEMSENGDAKRVDLL